MSKVIYSSLVILKLSNESKILVSIILNSSKSSSKEILYLSNKEGSLNKSI